MCKNQEKTTSEEVVPLSPSIHTQGHHHFDPEICSYTHPISYVVSEVSVVSNDLSSQSKSSLCHSSELLSCSNASLHDSFSVSPLPEFEPLAEPSFTWGVLDGYAFSDVIKSCYDEIVHWRRNLFKVLSGKIGNSFVRELVRLFRSFADSSALESVALYAAMVMPSLLLQRPQQKLSSKMLIAHLERRLSLWLNGDIETLLIEARSIQAKSCQWQNQTPKHSYQVAHKFSKLMMVGNVKAAIRSLSNNDGSGGVLSLNSTVNGRSVKDILVDKHPPAQRPHLSAIVPLSLTSDFHPILFDCVTPELIRSSALKIESSSGPSGLDAANWKRICTSFGTSSFDLGAALASFGRRLCTSFVDPDGLYPFLASRLIALDKQPGVRPIGVGESVRRLLCKAVIQVIGPDVMEVAESFQLCAGQDGGCEAAVHAVRRLFESSDCEAVLLIDASNAFNSLNCHTALQPMSCPGQNCY